MLKRGGLKAAELNVIRQFLKDNNIEAIMTPESPMFDLVKNMPTFDADGNPVQ